MEGFKEGYEFYSGFAGAELAAVESGQWIDGWAEAVEKEVDAFSEHMALFEGSGKGTPQLAGDVAEYWHGDTFNIDAAAHGSDGPRAEVPRSTAYASHDIRLMEDGEIVKAYQVKYYKFADESMKKQAVSHRQAAHDSPTARRLIEEGLVDENDPVYKGMERLVPSDQLEEAKMAAERKIDTESNKRPEQVERYRDTRKHLTDTVSDDNGIESKRLTREDALELAREARDGEVDLERWGLTPEQLIDVKEIAKRSLEAGVSAAMLAAVLSAAPAVMQAIQHLVEEGELDIDDLKETGSKALSGGARGFVTGTIAAAVTDAARVGLLGETFKSLEPSAISAVAVVSFDAIVNSTRVARGEMEMTEFAGTIARESFVAICSLVGTEVGRAVIPKAPILGALLGSLVGSAVGSAAWALAEHATVALCIESGVTLFGLVDQDYELPPEVIEQIGAEAFDYEQFMPERFEPDAFTPDRFEYDGFEPESIGIAQLRRGVFDISKVGYIAA